MRALLFALVWVSMTALYAQEPTRLQALPPGTVTYKSVQDLAGTPDAQAMFADREKRPKRTTLTGVEYLVYEDVSAEMANIVSMEKSRMTKAAGGDHIADAAVTPATLKLVAFQVEGANVSRIFEDPNGNEILLREWNYAKDGGSVLVIKEFTNTTVNGNPATFVALRPQGKTNVQWKLGWTTASRRFDLTMMADDSGDKALATLMKIATAL